MEKEFKSGDWVKSSSHGTLLIKSIKEPYDANKGGALIECVGIGRGKFSILLRSHTVRKTEKPN